MDLIDEIGNDLAFAFLVERKLSNKIASRDALDLIGKVKTVLATDKEDLKKRHISLSLKDTSSFQQSH